MSHGPHTPAAISRRAFLAGSATAVAGLTVAPDAAAAGAVAAGSGSGPTTVDLLIVNGYLLAGDAARSVYRSGGIAIRRDRIVAVGDSAAIKSAFSGKTVIDARGMMIVPGFVNTHSHPALMGKSEPIGEAGRQAAYPGVPGPIAPGAPGPLSRGGDFEAFLGPLLKKCRHGIGAERSYAAALHYFMLNVRGGSTCFVDGGAGDTRAIARAQLDLGVRGALTRTAYDVWADPASRGTAMQRLEDPEALLRESTALYKELNGAGGGLCRFWYNLFTDCSSSDELIRLTVDAARRDRTGICCHASAAPTHEGFSLQYFGQRSLERLDALGALGANWLGAHMGFVNDGEIARLAAVKGKVAHCPGTSCFSGKGIMSGGVIPRMMQAGVSVGLGSDGGDNGALIQEGQRAFAFHKDVLGDDRVLPPYKVFEMLTIDGARCALWDEEIGSLEAGKKADIVLIDIDQQRYLGTEPLARYLVAGQSSDVHTVLIDGRVILRERRFVTLDEGVTLERLRRVLG